MFYHLVKNTYSSTTQKTHLKNQQIDFQHLLFLGMINFRLRTLCLIIFLTGYLNPLFAQETLYINSLNKVIKPILTLRPDSSFEDILFLNKVLEKKEVVASELRLFNSKSASSKLSLY
jgi:hypothetical protein